MMLFIAQADSVFSNFRGTVWDDGRWRITVSALLAIGLYSLLYRENRFYRFVEHIFVGLAAGFSVVAIWEEVLYPQLYTPMIGQLAVGDEPAKLAYWWWAVLIPAGFTGFLVFSPKYAWLSRIPIGIIIGLWSGQQFAGFLTKSLPQVANQARPLIPNKWDLFNAADPPGTVSVPDAINNLIVVVVFIVVLSYFLYSFEQRSKVIQRSAMYGRWLLMVGFGVIFGATMMTRFVLFIDRAYFLLIEWLRLGTPY